MDHPGVKQVQDTTFKALIVDDDTVSRSMIAFGLQHENFVCDQARDGLEAADWIKTKSYDLVVTDLLMPKKNGHAFCLEMLKLNNRPLLVVHTKVEDQRLIKDLMIRGVDDIISKPTNYTVFAAKMAVLASKRRNPGHPTPAAAAPATAPVSAPASDPVPAVAAVASPPVKTPEADSDFQSVESLENESLANTAK